MGGERELVLFSALIAFGLIISAQNLLAVAFGVPLWIGCLFVLRWMAKSDPYMSKVYSRQLGYQSYYSPRSTAFRSEK
jgi:type IV secretion system protein VirB3